MKNVAYFPGLHGIRAIAALLVLLGHTDQFAPLVHLRASGFQATGITGHAVDLFFVLSGFLITYLLLDEKERSGRIHIKRFYLRRILRIWPAYYTAILLSCLLVAAAIIPPTERMGLSILLFSGMMANLSYAMGFAVQTMVPLWSVGVEEQFYLVWPHLVQRAAHPVRAVLVVFAGYTLVKLVVYFLFPSLTGLFTLILLSRIDIMCLGALGACWVQGDHAILRFIFRREVQVIAWLLFAAMCVLGPLKLHVLVDQEVNALVFVVMILNVATNPHTLVSLENAVLRWLGKVSYGIYVYHMIVIHVVAFAFVRLAIPASHLLWFCTVVPLTALVAFVSYRCIESRFLRLKERFAPVAYGRRDL